MANNNLASLAAITGVLVGPHKQAALLVSKKDEKRFMNQLRACINTELSRHSKEANCDSASALKSHQHYVFVLDLADYYVPEQKADWITDKAEKDRAEKNKQLKKQLEEEVARIKLRISENAPVTAILTGLESCPTRIRNVAKSLISAAKEKNVPAIVPFCVADAAASDKDAALVENTLRLPVVFACERAKPRKGFCV